MLVAPVGAGLALGDAVGAGVGDGWATVVGAAVVGAAVGAAVVDAGGSAVCGAQAPATTIAMDTASAPMSWRRPVTPPSLTGTERLVEKPYK